MVSAEICARITGFCVWVGSLTFGTLFGKALCFGSLKPAEVGWSIPGTAVGRGQVGTFSQSPEVLGSSALRSWGWAGRQMARSQPVAGSVRCVREPGCLHPRCWAPKVSGEHSQCVHGCLTAVSPTLSTCLRALSFQRSGQGPAWRERECFSAPSAPTLQGTLSSQHSARGTCNRKVTAWMKSQGHGKTDDPERGR